MQARFPELNATFIVNDRVRHTNTGYSSMLAQSATDGADFIKLDAEEVKVVVDKELRVLQASKSVVPKAALG